MDLETHIKPELWSAISSNYESSHYKDAILDAMRYVTEVLRAKTGSDKDTIPLAGEALGGDTPLLRLNKLQKQSEKDTQKGFHHLVMGLYGAVRHPRTHELMTDTQTDADAIIHFINYVVKVLDTSEEQFTIEGFFEQLLDPDFVESQEYVELLINEIPKNKRLDTLIEIFRRKLEISITR